MKNFGEFPDTNPNVNLEGKLWCWKAFKKQF